jgi:hypothetical protein
MTIKLTCEKCGRHLKAEDSSQDLELSCPKCGEQLKVPRIVGPCPSCKTLMVYSGRNWHIAFLWGMIGAVLSVLLIYTSGILRSNLFFICLGIAVAVLTLLTCVRLLIQRSYMCTECKTRIISNRGISINEVARGCCPICNKQMSNWDLIYRMIGVLLFIIGAALATLILATDNWRLLADEFTAIIVGAVLCYIFSNAYKRFRRSFQKCSACKIYVVTKK